MGACSASAEAGDGRGVFAATPSGQLKLPRMGNYCLTVAGDGAADADVAQGADVTATSSNAQHAVEHIAGGSFCSVPHQDHPCATKEHVRLAFNNQRWLALFPLVLH